MSFRQGETNPRRGQGKSQAFTGPQAISKLTHRTQRFQPLPAPLGEPPYHYDLTTAVDLDKKNRQPHVPCRWGHRWRESPRPAI